ncbi:MAG: hypothetical protein ACP5N1_01735 [Candidatus Woesearchaeota archaeon]
MNTNNKYIGDNIESTIIKESKVDISRDGTNKKLGIIAGYLGAIKQVPVLLKEIYKLMPNVETGLCANHDISNPINERIIINELKSTDFYSDKNIMKKIHLKTDLQSEDLLVDFSVVSRGDLEKGINYSYMDFDYSKKMFIWIDPLKFEPRKLLNEYEQNELRNKYGINKEDYVIIGGSITSQESNALLKSVVSIRHCDIFSPKKIVTIIVPRTETASNAIKYDAQKMKLYVKNLWNNNRKWKEDILFDNKKGILADLYSIADVTFIGGTLFFGSSGQNPLEPAFYGKRIIAGKHHTNNRIAYEGLHKSGLLTYIESASELETELRKVVPEEEMEIYRQNAAEFIKSEQGAAIKYAKVIRDTLYK